MLWLQKERLNITACAGAVQLRRGEELIPLDGGCLLGAQRVAQQRVEALGVLFLRHLPAAVEDFEARARVEAEELAGLLDGVRGVLLAPGERDRLAQARERRADVGVEGAGGEGRGGG